MHEGNEIGDVTADRGLPLELAGEAAVRVRACHRMRSASVGFRRSNRASPRKVLLSPGTAPLPVLGQQRPQPRCLLAVEHAALGRALASFRDRHHHPVQGVHVLLGRIHPGEDVAQIDQHGLALSARAQEFDLVELATRLSKKACIWCCEAGSERSGIANGSAPPVESLNHS